MKVAALQHDIQWKDGPATLTRLAPRIEAAASDGAALVVLTEMFATGFSPTADDVVEPVGGPTATFMADTADRLGIWLAGSVAIRESDGTCRNRFIAAGPAGEQVSYDKRHPFSLAGEHQQFTPGDDVVSFDIDGVRVTPFVCYDLRFADDFWRLGPDTDLFLVVANWPTARRRHWSSLLVARAIENQCYVVGVNRVGDADGLHHSGDSAIVSPLGDVLATASEIETALVAEIDPAEVVEVRSRFPFLQDRR